MYSVSPYHIPRHLGGFFVERHDIVNVLSSEDVVVAGIRYLAKAFSYTEIKLAGFSSFCLAEYEYCRRWLLLIVLHTHTGNRKCALAMFDAREAEVSRGRVGIQNITLRQPYPSE